jgi:hypothetical protein
VHRFVGVVERDRRLVRRRRGDRLGERDELVSPSEEDVELMLEAAGLDRDVGLTAW